MDSAEPVRSREVTVDGDTYEVTDPAMLALLDELDGRSPTGCHTITDQRDALILDRLTAHVRELRESNLAAYAQVCPACALETVVLETCETCHGAGRVQAYAEQDSKRVLGTIKESHDQRRKWLVIRSWKALGFVSLDAAHKTLEHLSNHAIRALLVKALRPDAEVDLADPDDVVAALNAIDSKEEAGNVC